MTSSSSKSEDSPTSSKSYLAIYTKPSPTESVKSSTVTESDYDDIAIESLPPEIAKLRLKHDASIEEVEVAIMKCKDQIYECQECSVERKWLVRYLVELRYRLEELSDVNNALAKEGISTMGHHMKVVTNPIPSTKQFCEQCSGVILSAFQRSYICRDCKYLCHAKCVNNIYRICAHVIASENAEFENNICPEVGLSFQKYECPECKTFLKLKDNSAEPRLCDYSGLYYCTACHWNNTIEIPARIIHNWDWQKKPVSQAALQFLTITRDQLFINLERSNASLFLIITELLSVKKLRTDLRLAYRYLMECKTGKELITPEMVVMIEVPHLYSISMLEMTKNGILEKRLIQMMEASRFHITNCTICSAKGYICEFCNPQKIKGHNIENEKKKVEILFPFDSGTVFCNKCNSLYHRACFMKKSEKCSKCIRLKEKAERDQIPDE